MNEDYQNQTTAPEAAPLYPNVIAGGGIDKNHPVHQYVLITYLVFAASIVLTGGLGSLIGVIMAYIKRNEVRGTLYYDHLQFLIRTFWITLIGTVVGGVLSFVLIGLLILPVVAIWHIYRVVFGLVRFWELRPVNPEKWFEI